MSNNRKSGLRQLLGTERIGPDARQQMTLRFLAFGSTGLSEFDLIESRVGCLTDAVYLPDGIGRRDLGTMKIL